MQGGLASAALMENAGAAVANAVKTGWTTRPVAIVCGPGNNGGDGYVAARLLAEAKWPVRLLLLGDPSALKGDAKLMADLFEGDVEPFAPEALNGAALIVDAIFGTGLSRDVEGAPRAAIEAINASPAPVVAVDMPSGVNADTGAIMGVAVEAARTVTFFAKKPAHALFPGRALCGTVSLADIGIKPDALSAITVDLFENGPSLWGGAFGRPTWRAHKYHRGHVFSVSGGSANTGAARLAAAGAARIGAGLVTVLSPPDAASVNAAHLTSTMLRVFETPDDIADALSAKPDYQRVCVIGPAAGVSAATRKNVAAALRASSAVVLDADGVTSFTDAPKSLFDQLRGSDVLTPHEGEYTRLFGAIGADGRLKAVRDAAKRAGCIVILKGPDSIIAGPDGRAAINVNAPADLATAGSGDVLAGFVAGLLAQGMPAFEAASAGVWFHGAAGQAAGPGLIADDLPRAVPSILRALLTPQQKNRTGKQ